MIIKKDLNQKELIQELVNFGIDSKTAKKEISETVKNNFLWFRIGGVVAAYNPKKMKKWCIMCR